MKWLSLFLLLLWALLASAAVDREAFTFTNYDLDIRVEPEQHRLAVRGKISLRNDSSLPQKNVALQISSSLDWRSIKVDGKPVDFVSQSYASDIDHTGGLSEAIVTLPAAVAPMNTIDLEVGYDGVVILDATRLTRIGVPENLAKHSEWDQIRSAFSAVRGIGYVTWYPVALNSANLSEGDGVEEAVGRWKAKEADAKMSLNFASTTASKVFFSGTAGTSTKNTEGEDSKVSFTTTFGTSAPTFLIANYQTLTPDDQSAIFYLQGQDEAAKTYSDAVTTIAPLPSVGGAPKDLRIFGLPDPDASAFVTQGMMLTPLKSPITNDAMLNMVYAKALASVHSPRAWVQNGLGHFSQAMFIEQEVNPRAALDYLKSHQNVLNDDERKLSASDDTAKSLTNAPDGLYLQTKAMYVWWMLRDMLGTDPRMALADYKPQDDADPKYIQHLIEKATKKDLAWFFDDWVYHDRGLPDFRVTYVNSAAVARGGYLATITVENLGGAGAEAPLTLRMQGGEITKRIEVRGKAKTTIRMEVASRPVEVVINDGSVPESDSNNNIFKFSADAKQEAK